MSKKYGALSASFALSLLSLIVACSSSSDSPSAANNGDAGSDAGGETQTGSAGAEDVLAAGAAGTAGTAGSAGARELGAEGGAAGEQVNAGGTSGVAGAASVMVTPNASPCSYAVTGGKMFPEAGAMFLCTANSRVYQQNGTGSFNALIGGAAYTEGGDSSTMACSIDSPTAPKAGDTWTMNMTDHPGDCNLGLNHMNAATVWANSSNSVPSGTASITFVSATQKHGMYKPEDVYYLYEVNVSITFANQQGGAPDVTFVGHFTQNSLPLGG
ncbi:MAG: hypothetical protein ABJB12_11680 [Pseudomonadota bacterium]